MDLLQHLKERGCLRDSIGNEAANEFVHGGDAASPRTSRATMQPAQAPTLYFIGVTTGESSIMSIFPHWATRLGLIDAKVVGVDLPLNAPPSAYRDVVSFIERDALSKGALVTSHKIGVLEACRNLFDEFDRYAELLGEISCISKRKGNLVGHATDAVTGLLALESFLPREHWRGSTAEALFLGAGGASVALTSSLLSTPTDRRPARFTVTDINETRIQHIEAVHGRIEHGADIRYVLVTDASDNDALVTALPRGSLVANGTGMGKDRPGSPVTDAAVFPEHGYAWDYNYRGELTFLKQAVRSQKTLTTVDGWIYFILGWTQVIAEVFHIDIPTEGSLFEELSDIATQHRRDPGFNPQS